MQRKPLPIAISSLIDRSDPIAPKLLWQRGSIERVTIELGHLTIQK
ncbi:hypothetical protein [Chamaesiphon sp. VAR_69_metabat_338]|nr:hypothetical protein [Chamaesiphon sp. VAR_69_metabat_338]